MVQFNLALREINCKVVYFGPGLSGRTTNLEVVHQKAPDESKGTLSSIATESDRTLFFDFMPLNLGTIAGMKVKFQLYTVPGQVYYNSTRKLVLRGADGVVFVADSSPSKMEENLESLRNLEECFREQGRTLADIPHVIQFNKRDLPNAMSIDEMRAALGATGAPCFEACANAGTGVVETFKGLSMLVIQKVKAMSDARSAAPQKAATPAIPEGGDSGFKSTPTATSRPFTIQRNSMPMPDVAPQETARPVASNVPLSVVASRVAAPPRVVAQNVVPPAPATSPRQKVAVEARPDMRGTPRAFTPPVKQRTAPTPASAAPRPMDPRVISSGRKARPFPAAVIWIGAALVGAGAALVVMFALK